MKFFSTLSAFLIVVLIFSCTDDSSVEMVDSRKNDNGNGQTFASATIGSAGGELGNNLFVLSVPAGAFYETFEMNVSSSENTSGFETISEVFEVTGIPTDLHDVLKIKIKPTTSDIQDVKILFMYDNLMRSSWQKGDGCLFLDASLVNGFYEAELNVSSSSSRPKLNKIFDDPEIGDFIQIGGKFMAVVKQKSYTSSKGRFHVNYPSTISLSDAGHIAAYLEDAYDKLSNMGFSMNRRTNWPLEVTVKSLNSELYGQACFSYLWGINYSTINVNITHVNETGELKTSLAHELMHIAQDFYDPFSWEHIWLDEATAVWFEELNTSQSEYVSSAMEGYYASSFLGIANICKKSTSAQTGYGYGLAPMIKYIVQMEGNAAVSEMYKLIDTGTDPRQVVDDVTSEGFSYWLEPFYNNYIMGNIYPGISTSYLISDVNTEKYEVTHVYVQDNLTEKYDDVSGKLYNFIFKYDLDEEKNYQMTFEPQWAHISLFKYKGGSYIESLGDLGGGMTIKDLNSYVEGGYGILALVTNGIHNSDYTGNKNITLAVETTEMENPLDFSEFKTIEFKLDVRYGQDNYVFFIGGAEIDSYNNGLITASQFSESDLGEVTHSVSIELFIDTETPMIKSFSVREDGHVYGDQTIQKFSCENIPFWLKTYEGNAAFEVNGISTCDKLTGYSFVQWDSDGNQDYAWGFSSVWCESDSDIEIEFRK